MDIDDSIYYYLIIAKARLALLKMTTIPWLELTESLLSVNMSKFLAEELQYDNIKFYYTDRKELLEYISKWEQAVPCVCRE